MSHEGEGWSAADVGQVEPAARLDRSVVAPERRLRAIERLSAAGHDVAAARARKMHNVMPPRPRGVTTALRFGARADGVFIANAGLDTIATIRDLSDGIPVHEVVRRHWHVGRNVDHPPGRRRSQRDAL